MPKDGYIEQSIFIEMPYQASLIQLIHQLQRNLERLPKDFEGDRLEVEINTEDGENYLAGFNLLYQRPETDAEKLDRQNREIYRREQERLQRIAQLRALQAEFEGQELPPVEEAQAAPQVQIINTGRNRFRGIAPRPNNLAALEAADIPNPAWVGEPDE